MTWWFQFGNPTFKPLVRGKTCVFCFLQSNPIIVVFSRDFAWLLEISSLVSPPPLSTYDAGDWANVGCGGRHVVTPWELPKPRHGWKFPQTATVSTRKTMLGQSC